MALATFTAGSIAAMIRITATVVGSRIAENVPTGVIIAVGSTIFVGITGVTKSVTKSGVKSDMEIGMITAVVTIADADRSERSSEIRCSSPFRKDAEWAWQG